MTVFPASIASFPRSALWLALFTCLLGTPGCLSRPSLRIETFALTAAPATQSEPESDDVLMLADVSVAPPFDEQKFVYRTGETGYERDPYAQFIAPPERLIASLVAGHLRGSGRFRDVQVGKPLLKATHTAQVEVRELYGDFRKRDEAFAVLTLRVVVIAAGEAQKAEGLWQKEITRAIRLKERTAEALAIGWSEAFAQIMTELDSAQGTIPSASPKR